MEPSWLVLDKFLFFSVHQPNHRFEIRSLVNEPFFKFFVHTLERYLLRLLAGDDHNSLIVGALLVDF